MQLEVQSSGHGPERGGVTTRCSVARGRSLSPGIQHGRWYWRDVVTGPPPRKRTRGDAIHVTLHGIDVDADVRVGFTTVVHVDPGVDHDDHHDDIIHVEERVGLQRRVLYELIERERAFSDRVALRWRSRLAHRLVAQRRYANRLKWRWSKGLVMRLVRIQAKVGYAIIRGTRSLLRSLVAGPDWLLSHSQTAGIHLGSRTGRSGLRRALRDPASATPVEKSVVLMLVSFGLLATVLLLNTIFGAFWVEAAPTYRTLLTDFTTSLLSTLALPLPVEPVLVARTLQVGAGVAFIGLFIGKMIGSWILFLLGDSLNDGLQKKTAKSPRMARGLAWLQKRADKWGFWLLIPINAVPLIPDVAVYAFAVSGMRFRAFMGGIAVGTAIKFGLIMAGVYLVGPELVQAFFAHPIATLRGT